MGVVSGTVAGTIGLIALVAGGLWGASASRDTAKTQKSKLEATLDKEQSLLMKAMEATPEQKARIRRKTRTLLTSPLTGGEEFGQPAPTMLGTGDPLKSPVVG